MGSANGFECGPTNEMSPKTTTITINHNVAI